MPGSPARTCSRGVGYGRAIIPTFSPVTRDFLQKICSKTPASVDMTRYGFIADSKVTPVNLLLKPLREKLQKICGSVESIDSRKSKNDKRKAQRPRKTAASPKNGRLQRNLQSNNNNRSSRAPASMKPMTKPLSATRPTKPTSKPLESQVPNTSTPRSLNTQKPSSKAAPWVPTGPVPNMSIQNPFRAPVPNLAEPREQRPIFTPPPTSPPAPCSSLCSSRGHIPQATVKRVTFVEPTEIFEGW